MILDDDHEDNFLNSEHVEAAGREEDRRREQPDTDYISFTDSGQQPDGPSDNRRRRRRRTLALVGLIVTAIIGGALYIRYGNPYVTDAQATGVIADVERRGVIFKTYECRLITADTLAADDSGAYRGDLCFSIEGDSLADRLQKYQLDRHPVVVTYKKYMGVLPWRGSSTAVITAVRPR